MLIPPHLVGVGEGESGLVDAAGDAAVDAIGEAAGAAVGAAAEGGIAGSWRLTQCVDCV